MKRLKPCPFCGGEAAIVFSGRISSDSIATGYIIAKCKICGAASKGAFYKGPEENIHEIPLQDTIGGRKTSLAWNMRVNNPNE